MTIINTGVKYVDRSRQEVLAINLAREGIEGVFQIRNTNRLRRWGMKEQCRLKVDPLIDTANDGCQNDERMQAKNYIMLHKTRGGQEYFLLSGTHVGDLDLSYYDVGIDDRYVLCYTAISGRNACPGQSTPVSEGRFFRQIKGISLVDKTTATAINCTDGSDTDPECTDNTAKEFRFCAKVAYTKNVRGEVELCSVITNFLE